MLALLCMVQKQCMLPGSTPPCVAGTLEQRQQDASAVFVIGWINPFCKELAPDSTPCHTPTTMHIEKVATACAALAAQAAQRNAAGGISETGPAAAVAQPSTS